MIINKLCSMTYKYILNNHINIRFLDIAAIQAHMSQQYEGAMRCVQVMPLDEEEGLPLPQIYGPVLVEEDLTALKKTRRPDEATGNKTLNNITEIFYVNNKLARRIFLKGEAGHGKTVFCLKLIDTWSGSLKSRIVTCLSSRIFFSKAQEQKCCKSEEQSRDDVELQSSLSLFDMVFYVPLRHAKQGMSSVGDLVCDSISGCDIRSKQNIKKMLGEGSIPCLVILDGLEEWRAPDTCRFRGFPDSDGLVNCTLLCTMRPWRMVNLQLRLDASFDKVVQILGLKNDSIETVISNVLVNFYGFDISSDLYKEKFSRLCKKAELPELESLMRIPLMLTASCLVWNEEDDASEEIEEIESYQATPYFMTFFYLKLKEITITRAENKQCTVKYFCVEQRQKPERSLNVPSILLGFTPIIDFIEILKPVGRLALQDLLSDEPHLVFPRNKLEREIGQTKVELAMKAGILSQTKAPGLSYQQRVKLSFYHKSIQEFIAALYITCGGTEALTLFRTHCNTIAKVIELSNMIIFVFGLDPVVGCQLSKLVKDVANRDADIIKYRESGGAECAREVREVYKMQFKWFNQMMQNLSYTDNTDNELTLHVTDVYIDYSADVNLFSNERGDVSVASQLVSMEDNSIVSVSVGHVRLPVHSIIQHLPRCTHLTILYIMDIKDTQSRKLLAEVLPQLVRLQCFVYGYCRSKQCCPIDTAVVRAVQQHPALRRIKLDKITPTDTVTLPPQLKELKLWHVRSAHFILSSLPGCIHLTSLEIFCCLTMKDCKALVNGMPHLPKLQIIYYNGDNSPCGSTGHVTLVSALHHLTQLTHIKLESIDLGDDGTLLVTPHMALLQDVELYEIKMSARRWAEFFSRLQHATQLTHIKLRCINLRDNGPLLVTPHMARLHKVELRGVKMSPRRWAEFLSSLLTVHHTVHFTLEDTNIDGTTVKTIHSSPHFSVTEEERWDDSSEKIAFHTVR